MVFSRQNRLSSRPSSLQAARALLCHRQHRRRLHPCRLQTLPCSRFRQPAHRCYNLRNMMDSSSSTSSCSRSILSSLAPTARGSPPGRTCSNDLAIINETTAKAHRACNRERWHVTNLEAAVFRREFGRDNFDGLQEQVDAALLVQSCRFHDVHGRGDEGDAWKTSHCCILANLIT